MLKMFCDLQQIMALSSFSLPSLSSARHEAAGGFHTMRPFCQNPRLWLHFPVKSALYLFSLFLSQRDIISSKIINHSLCLTGETYPQHVCVLVWKCSFLSVCLAWHLFSDRQTLGLTDGGCQAPAPWPGPLH